jgi:chitinase
MKRDSSVSSLLVALTAAGCLNVSASSTKASATGPVSADQGKARAAPPRIVGYFPDWTQGRRGCEYEVEHIDARLLTHASFAFAKVDPGPDRRRPRFSLAAYDPSDLGPSGQYARFNALKTQNPRLKTLISIGGWTHNEAPTAWVFTTMAASAASRAEFIESAIEFARQHGFDGIDLD